MNRAAIAAVVLAVACAGATPGRAGTFTEMLSTANRISGSTGVGDGNFEMGGGPAPFDTFIGDKSNGPDPSISFVFDTYGPITGGPITSATLQIGLYDGAPATNNANEVKAFTLDTVSIASELSSALGLTPPIENGEVWYTINLPATTFNALLTGTSSINLAFQGGGRGGLGNNSTYIAFGLDFATLTINTGSGLGGGGGGPPTIPEPPAAALLLTGLLGLGVLRRRDVG